MSNGLVISWLVIHYWRWSMSNRSPNILWPIDYSSMISITHWCNWLLVDDPSITHWLLYFTRKTLFLLSCTAFFFHLWFSLYLKFLLTMSRRKVLITKTDDSQLCDISLYPTLYLITKQLNTVTNQSENETNKYADKNQLLGYRFCFVGVYQQSKTAST